MRTLLFAAAGMAALAAPAFAQSASEFDRAETEMRDALAPSGAQVERVAPREIRVRMPSDITFDFNRAELRYEFMPRVEEVAHILNRHPGMRIDIVGHADAIGADAYNQRLSERRAYAVGNALIDRGVRRARIAASGMGEMAPIASNANEWGRARNRRVEIRLTGAQAYKEPRFDDPRFE